jgi:hypothetical protein
VDRLLLNSRLASVTAERDHLVMCIGRAAVEADQTGNMVPAWLDDMALHIAGVAYRGTRHLPVGNAIQTSP